MIQTEVAILQEKILQEYQAMKQGSSSLLFKFNRHAFMDARLKQVDEYHSQLALVIGEQEATRTICELYAQVMD